jgi:hypothetical protein
MLKQYGTGLNGNKAIRGLAEGVVLALKMTILLKENLKDCKCIVNYIVNPVLERQEEKG